MVHETLRKRSKSYSENNRTVENNVFFGSTPALSDYNTAAVR
jgi:hypothetical protein